ncbi:MAG: hypothetical protein JSS84_01140, partial [Bacteroidetes bacterium]|nr:hypothetical protein [Bacteroidota bacterium]
DDGNAHTVNDMITANCVCMGTVVYDCPALQANIGDACDDGNAHTVNDVITANCMCMGTVVYDCPALQANIGDACDDGNPNTINDVVTAACECAGSVPCIPPTIEATVSNSPICSGMTLTLGTTASGTGPLSYSWSGPGTYSPGSHAADVEVADAASGSYQVIVSNACGSVTDVVDVVVNALPSASISYPGSPFCTLAGAGAVMQVGTPGGVYSAQPAGLVLNASTGSIDPGASQPGAYAVIYTIAPAGGCGPFSTSASVVVHAATTWYADADGDGVGSDMDAVLACEQPPGYVAVSGDACPNDPHKVEPGVCGCGIPDVDTDGDGVMDCIDGCPTDPNKTAPGACGCGVPDTDTDGDGIPDCIDSCPNLPGQVGDSCDDGNAHTVNDVITANCECVGTVVYDCPGLQANIGDACDDGNAHTV